MITRVEEKKKQEVEEKEIERRRPPTNVKESFTARLVLLQFKKDSTTITLATPNKFPLETGGAYYFFLPSFFSPSE